MVDRAGKLLQLGESHFSRFPRGVPVIYLLAVLLPPLAVLFVGRPIQAVLNVFLCLLFYVPGLIHAVLVVNDAKATRRHRELVRAARR